MNVRRKFNGSLASILSVAFSLMLTNSSGALAETKILAEDEKKTQQQTRLATRSLVVNRFRSASLSNSAADRIFRDGSRVLQTNDGSGDVSCNLTLRRSGNVRSFNTGDGSIDSRSEFNAVLRVSGFVKVVNRINWCGGFSPNIIGCAPVPGSDMVVVRFNSGLEGILWAHEYGHTRGLRHRNSSTAVMNGTIGNSRRRVNSSECSRFLN